MKKLLTVLALLLIALSLFAAGAKEEAKSSEKIELTFWSPFTGGDGEFFDAMIEAFNKEFPNIKVNVLTSTNYADDALTHLQSGDYETVMAIPAVDKSDLIACAIKCAQE